MNQYAYPGMQKANKPPALMPGSPECTVYQMIHPSWHQRDTWEINNNYVLSRKTQVDKLDQKKLEYCLYVVIMSSSTSEMWNRMYVLAFSSCSEFQPASQPDPTSSGILCATYHITFHSSVQTDSQHSVSFEYAWPPWFFLVVFAGKIPILRDTS